MKMTWPVISEPGQVVIHTLKTDHFPASCAGHHNPDPLCDWAPGWRFPRGGFAIR